MRDAHINEYHARQPTFVLTLPLRFVYSYYRTLQGENKLQQYCCRFRSPPVSHSNRERAPASKVGEGGGGAIEPTARYRKSHLRVVGKTTAQ